MGRSRDALIRRYKFDFFRAIGYQDERRGLLICRGHCVCVALTTGRASAGIALQMGGRSTVTELVPVRALECLDLSDFGGRALTVRDEASGQSQGRMLQLKQTNSDERVKVR